MVIQRTLSIIKPDATRRNLTGAINQKLENAGLRIIDWSNPFSPQEVGYYIPPGNKERSCPQSNDVYVDRETGLIYMSDRWGLGLHILEYTGQ